MKTFETLNIWRAVVLAVASVVFASTSALSQSSVTSIYSWSATIYSGEMEMIGSVPTPQLQNYLTVRSGVMREDGTSIDENAPPEFITNSIAAVSALKHLTTGRAAYTGANWSIAGVIDSEVSRDAVLNELSALNDYEDWQISIRVEPVAQAAIEPIVADEVSTPVADVAETVVDNEATIETSVTAPDETSVETAINDMLVEFIELDSANVFNQDLNEGLQISAADVEQIQVTAPVEVEVEVADVAEIPAETVETAEVTTGPVDYVWSAKLTDGTLNLSGQVPSVGLIRFLTVRAGAVVTNDLAITKNAPVGFVNQSIAAITMLGSMRSGTAQYENGTWTIAGVVDSLSTLQFVEAGAGENVDISNWNVLLEVAPVTFTASKNQDGTFDLEGLLPKASTASYLAVLAGDTARVNIAVGGQIGPDFVQSAIVGVRALTNLEIGELEFDGVNWNLSGQTLSDLQQSSVRASIAALPLGANWMLSLEQAPLAELCATAVNTFSDTHTILFAPASANLQQESRSALIDLVGELEKCPSQALYVEGHTDADGPADSNMALSVARSEAVIDELVQLGVSYTRLYAVGYGETLPIETNETRQGKARNRRIVFALETP